MKIKIQKIYSYSLVLLTLFFVLASRSTKHKSQVYQDIEYFSEVFDRERTYRIYFPEGYEKSNQNYPVIYYFHGWGGRAFKSGAKIEFEMLEKLVDKYQIILVMMDGNMEDSEPRPYNIGYHQHMNYQVQMKDYFPELVSVIDSTYRTKTDRNSRAIIGFSMGGFMSFFISGKYPQLVSSAADLSGSVEFYVGFPDDYTLYPLKYTFENLRDVRIRLHNSSAGELSALNREVKNGAEWDGDLSFEYWEFEGGHEIDDPGETVVFEKAMKFVTDGFKKPMLPKNQWSHYDLYANFEVWDYNVISEKKTPGYIYLKNVSAAGFGYYTKAWLPNGPSLDFSSKISTAPIYEPNARYQVQDYNKNSGSIKVTIKKADLLGRLNFDFAESEHEIGIYKSGESPIIKVIDYSINKNQKLIRSGQENTLTLKMINLGELPDKATEAKISFNALDSTIIVLDSTQSFTISNDRVIDLNPVRILCNKMPTNDGSPAEVRIKVSIDYDTIVIEDELVIPVFFDVPYYNNLKVDDGLMVKDVVFGVGNGDGIASPGEEIMVYFGDHRLQLFYDDPYIIAERISDETLPGKWKEDGITLNSVIKISENCPTGHQLELMGKYETKTHMPMFRGVHWGKIVIEVH